VNATGDDKERSAITRTAPRRIVCAADADAPNPGRPLLWAAYFSPQCSRLSE